MIALITPTGARPKQIQLCTKFMKAQDYEGTVVWVIVDDAVPVTTNEIPYTFRDKWEIVKTYPKPSWSLGKNTQQRNMLEALKVVKSYPMEALFVIEDDDYYSPSYLRKMMDRKGDYDVWGEQNTIYYNPKVRAWQDNRNVHHSSLFQTAVTPAMIPVLEQICRNKGKFIDIRLFRHSNIPPEKINLFKDGNLAIGIKGLSGRGGIGLGHQLGYRMVSDPDMSKLKELIGDDYLYYVNV